MALVLTRRGFTQGGVALGLAAGPLARPAIAASDPVRIGWLAALTGPSSTPAIGFDRGVRFAVERINAAGGVKGRQIELVTRDTQGDPTKAVNATQEMISRQKVHAIWGPTNSGEALATTPIMGRFKTPNVHACVVDSLIDPAKYPNAFRVAPSNSQWDDAVRNYCLNIVKANKVAVVGDTTGYGTSAVGASVAAFKKDGADVVYQAQIDATQPDVMPDMLRMKNGGAQAIVVWSVSASMEARMFDARATLKWDVPFVGHPAMGTGDIKGLVAKPENWDKVYIIGYRSCSFDAAGKLPARTQDFVDSVKGKIELNDTSLWWVTCGVDAIELVAKAVAETGSSEAADIIGYWNTLKSYPGLFGNFSYTAEQHNGYQTAEVVMSKANSSRMGAFGLAPGYGV
jgi:branched-chain amino acid transport system substrate-binding protein